MSEFPYIVAAYTATWLVLAGYATYLAIRARRANAAARAGVPELPDA